MTWAPLSSNISTDEVFLMFAIDVKWLSKIFCASSTDLNLSIHQLWLEGAGSDLFADLVQKAHESNR